MCELATIRHSTDPTRPIRKQAYYNLIHNKEQYVINSINKAAQVSAQLQSAPTARNVASETAPRTNYKCVRAVTGMACEYFCTEHRADPFNGILERHPTGSDHTQNLNRP